MSETTTGTCLTCAWSHDAPNPRSFQQHHDAGMPCRGCIQERSNWEAGEKGGERSGDASGEKSTKGA
jgi:hypothetical protein